MDELREVLARPRPEDTRITSEQFQEYRRQYWLAKDERDVEQKVLPLLFDYSLDTNYTTARDVHWQKQRPLLPVTMKAPKPDLYDGLPWEKIRYARQPTEEEETSYIPSGLNYPVVPNFTLEAKGPFGIPGEAALQVSYNGACGQRAVETLASVQGMPMETGRSYAGGATYVSGTVDFMATSSRPYGTTMRYDTAHIGSSDSKDSLDALQATRDRLYNLRDYYKEQREAAANLNGITSVNSNASFTPPPDMYPADFRLSSQPGAQPHNAIEINPQPLLPAIDVSVQATQGC